MRWIIPILILHSAISFGQKTLSIKPLNNSKLDHDAGTEVYQFQSSEVMPELFLRQLNSQWEIVKQNKETVEKQFILEKPSDEFPQKKLWKKANSESSAELLEFKLEVVEATVVEGVTLCPFAILVPRLYQETINTIPNPEIGSMIWSIDAQCLVVFTGNTWQCLN